MAVRFEQAVDAILARIKADPLTYPLHDDRHREAILTRFPYSVIYRIEPTGDVTVMAVAHASREPGYWQGRD